MNEIYNGDALSILKTLPDCSVDMCVTSPPYYGLRDYGCDEQIGLEEAPEEYINRLVEVFHEIKRVLKDDGTLWVNIGDSYCGTGDKGNYHDPKNIKSRNGQSISINKNIQGLKHKDMIGIPWMLAFALRADGWYLRQDIIWEKPNPMPESVKDRCTKSHEYIFLLSKNQRYYFDSAAIEEPVADSTRSRMKQDIENQIGSDRVIGKSNGRMKAVLKFGGNKYSGNTDIHYRTKSGNEYDYASTRNKRDVWTVATKPVKFAHFATFPPKLIEPCILAGCRPGGVVIDPFFGSGTTGVVAEENNRNFIGIELNQDYIDIAKKRLDKVQTKLF